jgi:hypothetical protein
MFAQTTPRPIEARGNLSDAEGSIIALFERVSPSVVQVVGRQAGGNLFNDEEEGRSPKETVPVPMSHHGGAVWPAALMNRNQSLLLIESIYTEIGRKFAQQELGRCAMTQFAITLRACFRRMA